MFDFNSMNDDDLFSLFSDSYKDVHNFRPRGHSREYAVAWLTYELSPEREEARRKQREEEERRIEEEIQFWKDEQLRLDAEKEELYQEAKERMLYEMEEELSR